jgi:hypothetical protein
MKHTPGPWSIEKTDSYGASVVAIAQVAWCGANSSYGSMGNQSISARQAKANARLIAAAPDMLDALLTLMENAENVDGLGFNMFAVTKACRAIAKATGENK